MKIAYLILAHNQPEQLKREVNALNQANAYFYIHIDRKVVDKEVFFNIFSSIKNVTLISEYDVYWMGYSIVASTIALMKLAHASENNYKYFVLLSGQDYPIKSNQYINEFFEQRNVDLIDYHKVAYMDPNKQRKFTAWHYYDNPLSNPKAAVRKPLFVKLHFKFVELQHKLLPKRKFYKGMEPWFGAQWFALTFDTVGYILKFLAENPGYIEFMKTTEGPDETFFQTIICNSPLKTNLSGYLDFLDWEKVRKPGEIMMHKLTHLTYMDWTERAVTKPAVLDISYWEDVATSTLLFARKFDSKQSKELMDRIDGELLK